MKTTSLAWGWLNRDQVIQNEVFTSPDKAITAMAKRIGCDPESLLDDEAQRIGVKLCQVRVTMEVVRILDEPATK